MFTIPADDTIPTFTTVAPGGTEPVITTETLVSFDAPTSDELTTDDLTTEDFNFTTDGGGFDLIGIDPVIFDVFG